MEVMMMSSSSSADVAWRLGRIMLKYRPIAPKPVATTGCGGGGGSPPAVENCRGKKRKRVPAGGRRTRSRRQHSTTIATLPLMPEMPERKEEPASVPAGSASQTSSSSPTSVSFDVDDKGTVRASVPRRPVWSSTVSVEAVTDAWWNYEGEPFGYDVSDTCPAFVSEGFGRGAVVWANEAYRRMVGGGRVALVTEGIAAVPAGFTCFTCRVRVRYACGRKGKMSMVVPCDVWRLADGKKMVWRLDVKAALSLSSLS